MHTIRGVIPAGGKARRIHGFFKEMMPIGIDGHDRSKFIVSSEQIIGSMIEAGAHTVEFVLSERKDFISKYFADQGLFPNQLHFESLDDGTEDLGMPYTIDSVYSRMADDEIVLMGMPDTIIEPLDSFELLLSLLERRNADLALGLFRVDSRNKGGFVTFDPSTKVVEAHIDKTSPDFPDSADNTWAIACWNKRFTDFLHSHLEKRIARASRPAARLPTELLFGEIIDAAVLDGNLNVVADYIDEWHGLYWDITEPEKYFELLRYYDRGIDRASIDRKRRQNLVPQKVERTREKNVTHPPSTHTEVYHMNTSNITVSGGQVGNIGDHATNTDNTLNQQNVLTKEPLDLAALARELELLRTQLQADAKEPDHFHALANVASAEASAKVNDEPNTLKYLKSAGKWALDTATKIGTGVAAKAIEGMLHLP